MQTVFYSLLALIGLTPLLLFFDRMWVAGAVELYAAVALAVVAVLIRPGEARHWIKTIRLAVILAALPLLWIIVQLLPLPLGSISSSIWQSAGTALGTPLWSSGSVDPGLTLLSLCRYVTLIVIAIIAAAASIDRQQAERVLIALGCATFLMALLSTAVSWGGLPLTDLLGANSALPGGSLASVFGTVLFASIGVLVVERHLTRRSTQDFRTQFLLPLAGAIFGFAVCLVAILASRSEHALFAAACGLTTVVIIQFVRRLGLDWRAAAALGCVAIGGAFAIVATKGQPVQADLSMRYAAVAPAEIISVADRLVSEVGLGGSGAGTLEAIYRLYAPQDASSILPPTSAAQIAIELGRPALWVVTAIAIVILLLCARGGFNRGRDFFYSIGAAGVSIAALISAFSDIGLNNLAVSIVLAVTLGLGLGQSVSRTL